MNEHKTSNGSLPEKIIEITAQQTRLLTELKQLIEEEKTALTDSDLQGLMQLAPKKEHQIQRIEILDGSLQEILRQATGQSGETTITLEDLRPFVDSEHIDTLEQHRDIQESLRGEILAQNVFNQRFAKDILGFVSDAINTITGAVTDNHVYQSGGGKKAVGAGPSLISREV